MNAIVQFPDRAGRDLDKDLAKGLAAIDRKVCRIVEDHVPHKQASRLVIRSAVLLSASSFGCLDELDQYLDQLKTEARRMRP